MKHWLAVGAIIVSLCSWKGVPEALGAGTTLPPVAAFGNVAAMTSVVLSPNGQQLAWIDNSGPLQAVEAIDFTRNARLLRMESEAELKIRDLDWADDDTLLVHNSITRSVPLANGSMSVPVDWLRIKAINVRTRKSVILLQKKGEFSYVTGVRVLALRTATPRRVVMASWDFSATNYRQETGSRLSGGRKDSGWTYNLFDVDTTTGDGRMLAEGTPFTCDWVVDISGQPVARVEWEAERERFSVLYRRGTSWTQIFELATARPPVIAGLSADGSALLMFGALDRAHQALWRLPIDGSAPQALIEDDAYDVSAPIVDPYSRAILGAWKGGPSPEIQWLDASAEKKSAALRKTFGGSHAHVIGRSADNSRVLVDVSTSIKPSTYYLIDYQRGAADVVGEQYPGLVAATLGEVQVITYKARDGYEIPAYLTLPPGAEGKQLPMVALPHGGPQARDVGGFDWLAQFLASRGYAVLQPQFRGSTGLGEAHAKAGYRQWGGLMQDDVTDAVKAMVERGVADPKRICIAGASYGGYAALAGAAFTPELYACAISINGVSDLPLMLGYEKLSMGSESDSVAYWAEHIGAANDENVIAKSPARAARGVRAPILLLHGSSDTVVPPVQTQVMFKALQAHGKPYKFVELPGEDHWLSRSDTRIRVLTEMETFLWSYLGPQNRE